MKLSIEEILDKIEKLNLNWHEIRKFIKNLNLTPEQMEILVNHENEDVRIGLTRNSKIPEKIMMRLANDENYWVKWELAENPNITKEIMTKLANDESKDVIYGLAGNPNLPKKIIILLTNDDDKDVQTKAFKKLKKLNSLKKEEIEEAYDLIMKSKHISRKYFKETFNYIADKFPELSKLTKMFKTIILKGKREMKLSIEEILEKIEKLNWYEIKDFMVSLDLTPEQIDILANHENEWVRWEIAENPKITEEIMIKLANDKYDDVKYGLAGNPNLTKYLMLQLANDKYDDIRYKLAKNPEITKNLMIKLASDKEDVRYNLTLNPKITKKLIIRLASDVYWDAYHNAFKKLKKLNSLKKEEIEEAYDLIMKSKHISRKNFEETFNFIINKFPELSKLTKMFKIIILKGKRDLK